jgi:sugar diacid utilization regulator
MNVLRAAQVLGVHPNTIYARFQRIFDITGLQPRTFGALATLLVVADCKSDSIGQPVIDQ